MATSQRSDVDFLTGPVRCVGATRWCPEGSPDAQPAGASAHGQGSRESRTPFSERTPAPTESEQEWAKLNHSAVIHAPLNPNRSLLAIRFRGRGRCFWQLTTWEAFAAVRGVVDHARDHG